MSSKVLTDIAIRKLRPGPARREIPDPGARGLYVVIQPSGRRGFAVRYRFAGRSCKLTLEPAPGEPPLSLAMARKLAAAALHQVEQGIDPAKQKRGLIEASRDAAISRAADTVEAMVAQYVERYAKIKNRSWRQAEAILNREIVLRWRGRTVHEITTEDVEDLVDRIAAKGHPVMANRVLSQLRRWFAWMAGKNKGGRKAEMQSRLRTRPTVGVELPGEERSRDRVLTDAELKALWEACGREGEPLGHLIKIMILTGQRRSEVAGMRRGELDFDKRQWTIPAERTKNKLAHVVPLSDQALTVLGSVTPISGDFVFTSFGAVPVANFTIVKKSIDARMKPAAPWVLHDIRRSVATGMAEIGIAPHIIEAVLNHISGHKSGVAGIYNRASYGREKAEALQRWADHVEGLVAGKAARVVPLRPRVAGELQV